MNFGDLVRVIGYYPRIYQIDGYRFETYHYPDETWTETVYELTDVQTGDWLEADKDDLTLVANAEKAAEYLETMKPTEVYTVMEGVGTMWGAGKSNEPPKPTARELSAQEAERRKQARKERAEAIDRLLDIASWNRKMLDKTNDETYGDALMAVEAELKKLTEDDVK